MSQSRYQLPVTTDLSKVGPQIRAAYTRYNKNQQRLDFFDLYDILLSKASREEQISLLIFELELIEQTYKTMSPERRIGWFWSSGSEVYSELHKLLGEVSVDDRLIEINKLRRYVRDKLPFDAINCATWPTTQALLNNIEQVESKLVKVKEKIKINKLLHTMPDLGALKNNISAISESYHASRGGKSENSKRESTLAFIDFVATTSDEIYGTAYRDKKRDENEKDAAYRDAYNAHRGMILYALLQVQDEYNGWLLSPHRSALFRECLIALGYSSLKEISHDERIEWLRALSTHLDTVRTIKGRIRTKDNKTAYIELLEKWQERKLHNLDAIKHDIEDKIFRFEEEKKQPSFIVSTAKSATSSLAAYGVQRAAVGYITEYALIPAVTATLSGLVAGPVGVVVGGVVGPFVANRIGRLISENLIPAAVGNIAATIIDRIASKMGEAAAAAAFALFSVSANGMQKLLGFYKEHLSEDFDEEWVNTLLDLPDSILSAQEKQKIRKVRGLPEPQSKLSDGPMPKIAFFGSIKMVDNYDAGQSSKSTSFVPASALGLIS